MKLKWTLLLTIASLLPVLLLAQDKPEKGKQKIVIIKKSVDEDGNEVVEKIVREGAGDEKMEWEDENGHVIIKLNGGDVEWNSLEDMDIDVDLEDMDIELEEHLEHKGLQFRSLDGEGLNLFYFELKEDDDDNNFFFFSDEDDQSGKRHRKVIIIEDGDVIVEQKPIGEENTFFPESQGNLPVLDLKAFEAFPNPADNQLTVRFTGEQAPVTVRLLDASGQQLYKEYIQDFGGAYDEQIGLKGVPEGLLLLTVEQEGRVFTEKVVIARQ